MNQPLLVLDVHYLAHRAFHTAKDLSWKGKATGVIFGFLKSITYLKDEFQTDRIAFCFEHPHLFRRDIYPAYKRRRNSIEKTEEEKESYNSLFDQISELRRKYLPLIGFKNIFCFRGFESDDIMAAIANQSSPFDPVILVTADSDLHQCLREGVTIFSPQKQKILSNGRFRKEKGIYPRQWAEVKAMAGCKTDEVQGIKGVGEVTAIKYIRRELPSTHKAFQSINSEKGQRTIRRNLRLVKLPYYGCPIPQIQEDEIDREGWKSVCASLGMRSIAQRPPLATRKMA